MDRWTVEFTFFPAAVAFPAVDPLVAQTYVGHFGSGGSLLWNTASLLASGPLTFPRGLVDQKSSRILEHFGLPSESEFRWTVGFDVLRTPETSMVGGCLLLRGPLSPAEVTWLQRGETRASTIFKRRL